MAKILVVSHRAAPFPGGTEEYTANISIELYNRGHEVTLLAHEHQGNDYFPGNIQVTNDYNILLQKWDLILVHGCDCISQNITLMNSSVIKSPICYMIIKPSESDFAMHGMKHSKYLAYSTSMDLRHIKFHGHESKARRIRHGIVPSRIIRPKDDTPDFTYVSAGGYYPHKKMSELSDAWNKFGPHGMVGFELVMHGYADDPSKPETTWTTEVNLGKTQLEVMDDIANSHGYIMNSSEEGFGLVLLEAMLNKVPVYARNIAGAKDMFPYVMTYETEEQLFQIIKQYENLNSDQKSVIIQRNYEYVMSNHTIIQTVNDIEDILMEENN